MASERLCARIHFMISVGGGGGGGGRSNTGFPRGTTLYSLEADDAPPNGGSSSDHTRGTRAVIPVRTS